MIRRVANRALKLVRTEGAGDSQTAAPTPVNIAGLQTFKDEDLGGLSAMVANLAHGQAPDVVIDRVVLTSGAKNDSAVTDVLNTSEDGAQFWGPIDNDSARSKAIGETLIIDQWECIQCGTCVENTDAVFALPDDCKASVFNQEGPMDLIQDAIDACPVTCIQWTADPESYDQINDHEGKSL